jgi:hypothetical protein
MAFITTKNLKLFRVNSFSFNAAIVTRKVIIKIQKSALFGIQFHTQLPPKDKTALFTRSQKNQIRRQKIPHSCQTQIFEILNNHFLLTDDLPL